MIETWFHQDIMQAVKVQYLDGNVFSADNNGNKVGVRLTSNGSYTNVIGNVSANVIRSDGITVPVTGDSDGDKAWVILPQSAYAVPGVISIVIKSSYSSNVSTICAVVANVYQSSTDTIVDPGTIIPSIETLIAAIEAAVATIPADYSSLWTSLAPTFSASKTGGYKEGEYVTYNGGLYRFTQDHSGSWASGHVASVTLGDDAYKMGRVLEYNNDLTLYHKHVVTSADIVQGGWAYSTPNTNANRIRSAILYKVAKGDTIIFTNTTHEVYFGLLATPTSSEYVAHLGYVSPSNTEKKYVIPQDGYLNIVFEKTNEANILPSEYNSTIVIYQRYFLALDKIKSQYIDWELGGVTVSGGKIIDDNTQTDRIRSNVLSVPEAIRIVQNTANIRVAIFFSDENGDYEANKIISPDSSGKTKISVVPNTETGSSNWKNWTARIVAINESGSTVTIDGVMSQISIELLNDQYAANGKQVLVYQYGGNGGNDWCFVRTPDTYNQFRDRPYPFVICNHGNGWVMDGTVQLANWTKRTMYVPLDDPDYISDPTEYNGTSDSSLWYSNPTIEALLAAGYIVCGCENYGDNLYGNNNCRNACVDFFYHMVKTYNVEDRCYMIGASNGALTALNAAYLLQGKVKAMILQYPITCLVNQYEHYPNHQAGIRSAYGITDPDISIANLTKAVATHDPLTVDVVSGTKVGVFPPTKLYYSPNDAVVNCNYNSIPFATMLNNSNKVVSTVVCSGEHGDHTHFDPSGTVAWFNAN